MEPQQPISNPGNNNPLMQPIAPGPDAPQYVPQPTQQPSSSNTKLSKKIITIAAAALIAALLIVGALWSWAQKAKEDYVKATGSYSQSIQKARDDINNQFKEQGVGITSAEAPAILEKGSEDLRKVIRNEPKQPKLAGVAVAAKQTDALTAAAKNYADAMDNVVHTYHYYTAVTAAFKPIKSLGSITPDNQKQLATEWSTFVGELKKIKPFADIQSTHTEVTKQAEAIGSLLSLMVVSYEQGNTSKYSELIDNIDTGIEEVDNLFNSKVGELAVPYTKAVNTRYDELDSLLKQ